MPDQRYVCRCGWELPSLSLDVEYPPHAQHARHFRVMVCCPVCDVFIQVAVDMDPGIEHFDPS